MKWKTRLADYFSWLRDENWHKEKLNEVIAFNPWFGATTKQLIEKHILDEPPLMGHIYQAVLLDGSTGYLVEIFEPVPSETGHGLVGRGHPGMEAYRSVEEARARLPEVLAQARMQEQARAQIASTFVDEEGNSWLPYFQIPGKEGGKKSIGGNGL